VSIDGLNHSEGRPEPKCYKMRTNEHGSRKKGKVIAKEDFERMSIFASNSDRCFEFVMLFVDMFIDFGMVQHPVGPIEQTILSDHETKDLKQYC